jgi:hypothetical protein
MMIYGMPAYQLGDDDAPDPAVAKAALRRMRGALARWLKFRLRNDAVAAGKRRAKVPPKVAKVMLEQNRDWAGEQKLADQIHALLSEVFDPAALPSADLRKNKDAAVELAKIAISGKLPDEAGTPTAAGFVWLWPMVAIAGVVAFTIATYIRTQAEVQMDKEHTECIKMGACTDYGFWLKAAAIGLGGYFLWTRTSLGTKIKGALK